MPKVEVREDTLQNYPPIPNADVVEPGFAPTAVPLDLFYPGPAYAMGVTEGTAAVGVELDESGKPTDFLVLEYTQPYFADELLAEAKKQTYAARTIYGKAVPSRFIFNNRFIPDKPIKMVGSDAIQERQNKVQGGPPLLYRSFMERELDGGGLKMLKPAYALIPEGYSGPGGEAPKVLVSFYVDETGHVRLPTIASSPSAALAHGAIGAASHWQFEPPKINGKPVLVFALWRVLFVPRSALKASS